MSEVNNAGFTGKSLTRRGLMSAVVGVALQWTSAGLLNMGLSDSTPLPAGWPRYDFFYLPLAVRTPGPASGEVGRAWLPWAPHG